LEILIGIIVAISLAVIAHFIIKSIKGARYWTKCEKDFESMIANGYSKEEALLQISKARYPELDESTHIEIVNKFNDVHLLVNFLTSGLIDVVKLDDEVALEILRNTTIEHYGGYKYKVRTKWQNMSRRK